MRKSLLAIILVTALMFATFSGCTGIVADVAGNVMEAAKAELENQIKSAIEENKIEIVELKVAFGKLNDNGGSLQFFGAVLVRSQTDELLNSATDSLKGTFDQCGVLLQTESEVKSDLLIHKSLKFKFEDFNDGNVYHIIYFYTNDISSKLPNFDFSAQ